MTRTQFKFRASPLPRAREDVPSLEVEGPVAVTSPGWFESSFDLMQGLEVREGLPTDASLNEWLQADASMRVHASDKLGMDGLELL
jgi:hypothetical protein